MVIIIEKDIIRINYPKTEYYLLNLEIINKLNFILSEFFNYQSDLIDKDIYYDLDIKYYNYTYDNYISYVFYINVKSTGIHTNTIVYTINYDKYNNKIITINDLINNNSNILNNISLYCVKKLSSDKSLSFDLINKNITTNMDNYKYFSFCSEGLIIYFQQYVVSPYIVEVTVPYSIIKDK